MRPPERTETQGEELDETDRFASLPAILTDAELAELERRFLAAWNTPHRWRYLYKGRWRYALPLPWHARLRLWWTGRINLFGCWLADRRQFRAAKAVWRIKENRRAE